MITKSEKRSKNQVYLKIYEKALLKSVLNKLKSLDRFSSIKNYTYSKIIHPISYLRYMLLLTCLYQLIIYIEN